MIQRLQSILTTTLNSLNPDIYRDRDVQYVFVYGRQTTQHLRAFQDEQDDHPDGVGSPLGTLAMEMTPGQMMEAEMSASGCLLDDVMMGPTGDCGVDPDTTDLLMSGLTDEPLFSGIK